MMSMLTRIGNCFSAEGIARGDMSEFRTRTHGFKIYGPTTKMSKC